MRSMSSSRTLEAQSPSVINEHREHQCLEPCQVNDYVPTIHRSLRYDFSEEVKSKRIVKVTLVVPQRDSVEYDVARSDGVDPQDGV